MEEWKKELDLKMINMERRLLVAIKQQNNGASGAGHSGANAQSKFLKFGGSSVSFSFPVFFLFVFVCILIGRFSPM